MILRIWLILLLALAILVFVPGECFVSACCPAGPVGSGKPVVNADQSVIMIWDADKKMQHFIRRASFKSAADEFGFLVPSPTEPTLAESGNDAFPYLQKLTEPEIITKKRPSGGGGCSLGCPGDKAPSGRSKGKAESVRVLKEFEGSTYKAKVLEASSADALQQWLKENGYAYSPEVRDWAKPYVEGGWKITALKVKKATPGEENKGVSASALRLSFTTDRPVFPYREPDYKRANEGLGANSRLLRIYFLAEVKYQGELTKESPWTGKVAWANKLSSANREKTLELLGLPQNTGPSEWWLTEFEDRWPYRVAPADVYFSRDADQEKVKREPIIRYVSAPFPTDAMTYALAMAVVLPPLVRRVRRKR
jgi:hypothetical protein